MAGEQAERLCTLSWALWVTLYSLGGKANCFFLGCIWELQNCKNYCEQ